MELGKTMTKTLWSGLVAAAVLVASPGAAQDAPPAPDPTDVESMDAIMAAVYDVISGPAGEARDWDRFRSLFAPQARLIPTGRAPDGSVRHQVLDVEGYIEAAGPGLEANGFFEAELGRVVERYGPVVHLMSAYDSRQNADDPEPFARGVNSFQLFDDGERWWVMTIFWASETPDNPIPERFLTGGGM